MRLSKFYTESDVDPSPAARALLDSLKLPVGAAVVWPTTRAGKLALVVQLGQSFSARAPVIPTCFEGYEVIVERGTAVPASGAARPFRAQLH